MLKNFNNQPNFQGKPDQLNNLYPDGGGIPGDVTKNYKPVFGVGSTIPGNSVQDAGMSSTNSTTPPISPFPDQNFSDSNHQHTYPSWQPQKVITKPAFDTKIEPTVNGNSSFYKNLIKPNSTLGKISNFLARKWLFVLILIIILALALAGVWLVVQLTQKKPGPFQQVKAELLAPSSSPSGSPSLWRLEIINQENVDLLNVVVRLEFDSKFRFYKAITPQPSDPRGNLFTFTRIDAANKPGGLSKVVIEFEGVLTGLVDEETFMSGLLIYTPEPLLNYPDNREQILIERQKTVITRPLVTATINPDNLEVEVDTEATIKVVFENLSNRELNNLRLKMTYPERQFFEYVGSELILSNLSTPRLNPSDGDNIWDIQTLPAAAQQELYIRGKIKGSENTEHRFTLEIQMRRTDNSYQNILTTTRDIKVVARPLVLQTYILGKQNNPTFRPGEALTFQINYKNQSKTNLNNVEIIASINDPAGVLDFSTIKFQNNIVGYENNKSIIWNPKSASFLTVMPPGLEGTLGFTINVKQYKDMVNPAFGQGSYILIPKVEAKADGMKPIVVQGQVYRAQSFVNFTRQISFQSHPTDAEKRIYRVRWEITTGQNAIKDVKITTSSPLPGNPWRASSITPPDLAQALQYNSTNGQIILTINRLEPLLGSPNKPSWYVEFELEVGKQLGKFEGILLMRATTFEAVDEVTGQSYTITLSPVETSQVR
jgi:uncharacterized repeat protein (TIGR01451 family)